MTQATQTDQPYQLLPPLAADQYADLKADIRLRGVMVPVEVDENGTILDGYHRAQAWEELRAEGVDLPDYPTIAREGMTEDEKCDYAEALNMARRHLTREQRRDLIERRLKRNPQKSNPQIAAELGVTDKTVGVVRERLEAGSEIPRLERREGADGKTYPARMPERLAAVTPALPPDPNVIDARERFLQKAAEVDAQRAALVEDEEDEEEDDVVIPERPPRIPQPSDELKNKTVHLAGALEDAVSAKITGEEFLKYALPRTRDRAAACISVLRMIFDVIEGVPQ